jgi:succinate dehydrogenase/fumarate reductase flavoprotein subunit
MASQFFIGSTENISNFATKMSDVQLDIIVIGAGIAGLGAAITLSRAGHNVTVGARKEYERSKCADGK